MIDIVKECQGAKRIGLSGHIRPDGDAISSCLALRKYLMNAFPKAAVKVNLELPLPSIFSEIWGYDTIDTDFPEKEEKYDVYFALDTNFERLGQAQPYFQNAGKRINIDHHVSNGGVGDINVIEPEISSTAELLVKILDRKYFDAEIAKALYIGMIHDTGVFQYSCTSPETMRRAADLMEYGFDFPNIILKTFYEKTYLQSQIMGRCLMESIRFMNGRCIASVVDLKTQKFYGVSSKDFEGIVNQLRNIRDVDCAIFMYELSPLEFKVSMRSSEAVDVAEIGEYFGGGGHVRAAGCNMHGTFYDCVNNISEQIEKQLKKES
ncbi:MAG: bifunctional oligoribonuclease/PAP phosphatase NrnA [Lachnospiraceae bacterium]|nr:bifunctional oligoribonuclease/PAP phosphatase NrnA [Lachnospiraceae bacterium]